VCATVPVVLDLIAYVGFRFHNRAIFISVRLVMNVDDCRVVTCISNLQCLRSTLKHEIYGLSLAVRPTERLCDVSDIDVVQ
jgi:hypothetical protein